MFLRPISAQPPLPRSLALMSHRLGSRSTQAMSWPSFCQVIRRPSTVGESQIPAVMPEAMLFGSPQASATPIGWTTVRVTLASERMSKSFRHPPPPALACRCSVCSASRGRGGCERRKSRSQTSYSTSANIGCHTLALLRVPSVSGRPRWLRGAASRTTSITAKPISRQLADHRPAARTGLAYLSRLAHFAQPKSGTLAPTEVADQARSGAGFTACALPVRDTRAGIGDSIR